jgi:hypothetical protein
VPLQEVPDHEVPDHEVPDQEVPDQEVPDQLVPLKSPPSHSVARLVTSSRQTVVIVPLTFSSLQVVTVCT